MTRADHLQWTAAIVSVLGSWLVGAVLSYHRFVGFTLFLLANALWAVYGVLTDQWGIVLMQAVFTLTSLRGLLNNRSRP